MEISSVNGYDVAFCDAFTDTKADKMTKATHQFATDKLAAISTQWDPRVKAGPIPSDVVSQSSFIDMDLLGAASVTANLTFSWGGSDGVHGDAKMSAEVTDDKGSGVEISISQEFNQDGLGKGDISAEVTYSISDEQFYGRDCNNEPDPHPLD